MRPRLCDSSRVFITKKPPRKKRARVATDYVREERRTRRKDNNTSPIHQDGSGSFYWTFWSSRLFCFSFVFGSPEWFSIFFRRIVFFCFCFSFHFISGWFFRTWFDWSVNVSSGLVVDPVESGLDGQTGQHAVLGAVAIRRRDVHASSLVVQRVGRV